MTEGIIEKALSGFYYVNAGGKTLTCRARGKFRRERVSPLVGDRVVVQELGDGMGYLEKILPRKNFFKRPSVANIDQLVIVASMAVPETDPFLIDRVASIARLKGCGVVVCVNKCDLITGDSLADIYRKVGFPTVCVSAATGEGMGGLIDLIAGKVSAFTGNSGVGKSSILNAVEPEFAISTNEISERLGRGKHTTRHVELYHLSCGADVVDTPGFSSFDSEEMDIELRNSLPDTFPEFEPFFGLCRFTGCSHTKEKGCAVLQAVKDGKICPTRHASYVRLYEELKTVKDWERKNN